MKSKKITTKFVTILLVAVMMLGLFVTAFAVYDTSTFSDVGDCIQEDFWTIHPRRLGIGEGLAVIE